MSSHQFYFLFFGLYFLLLCVICLIVFKKFRFKSALVIFLLGLIFALFLFKFKRKIYEKLKRINDSEIPILRKKSNCPTTQFTIKVHRDDYSKEHRPKAIKSTNNGYIRNQKVLKKYLSSGKLVSIDENDGYYIKHLAHSSKHLTPLAYKRLKELGILFRSLIVNPKAKKSYFVISSVTRDENQQEILRQLDKSATKGLSTHSFGVSFDISSIQSSGYCEEALVALSKALTKMQEKKQLLICPEKGCYHITVIK
jgi:hypothetical protein